MAIAIALCPTFGCTGTTVYEDVPSCFRPNDQYCEQCLYFAEIASGLGKW